MSPSRPPGIITVACDPELVIRRANPLAARYLLYTLAVLGATLLVYGLPTSEAFRVTWAYLFPALLCRSVLWSLVLLRHAPQPFPRRTFWIGAGLIAGSTVLDIVATYLVSPDLAQEANPLLRALVDSGQGLSFVYGYALVFALIYVAMASVGWAAFLAHSRVLIASAFAARPTTLGRFLKAALGAGHLTTRQFWLPLRLSECARAYHAVCFLWAVAPVTWSVSRWYAGLVWLDLVPNALGTVATLATLGSIAGYLLWLRSEWERGRAAALGANS